MNSNISSSSSAKLSKRPETKKALLGLLAILAIVLAGGIFWAERNIRLKKEIKLPEIFEAAPANLVINPDFENGATNWGFWADGSVGYQGAVVSGGYQSDHAYRVTTGSDEVHPWGRAACVNQGAPGFPSNPAFENPANFAGKTLKLSGYIKTLNPNTTAYLKVPITTASGRNPSWLPGVTGYVTSQDWQYVEKVMDIPADVTRIDVDGCSSGVAGGQAWFDEITVSPPPGPTPTPPPTGPAAANLALNKPVTASGNYTNGFDKSYAVDGNPGLGWNSGDYAPQWIMIDLGSNYSINKVRLLAEGTPVGTVYYDIKGSLDGSGYTTILSDANTVSDMSTWGEHTFNPVTVRYLRINATDWASSWVAIREIEVYSFCEAGSLQCDGDSPQVCKTDGSQWVDSTNDVVCGSGKVCQGGQCVTPAVSPSPGVSPSPSPDTSPPPSGPGTAELKVKVGFFGLAEGNWAKLVKVCLDGTDQCSTVKLDNNGVSPQVSFDNISGGSTYTLKVKSPGYLTVAKQKALNDGDNGTVDMGKMPAGDLNANDLIEGLDWTIMESHFGEEGE